MRSRVTDSRIRLLLGLFALVLIAALSRAAWLQAVQGESLEALASSQHRETVVVPARRGTIYDRMGVELAIGEQATTVYANPKEISDPRQVATLAARELELDSGELYGPLQDRSLGFVYVARKTDPRAAGRLERRRIPGLGFYPEERRVYPQRGVAAGVLGFAGLDNQGLAGLEIEYDRVLAGRAGAKTVVRDPSGTALEIVGTVPVEHGRDLTLTLDHTIQGQTERVLRETRARWNAKSVTAVVLDPRTGEVLALATEPGFDANRFAQSAGRTRNRAIEDTYEPGSTFKVVTIGAALEEGTVTPGSARTLRFAIKVADRVIHDALPRPTRRMTVAQILSQSSNVGVITVALELGEERLAHWIERFGFGRPTGVDLPAESAGIVLPPERWSGSTIGNVPIGQGIAVTPLQMASVYGAIANGGVLVRPHVVSQIGGEAAAPAHRRRILSKRTATQLTRMLQAVVRKGSGYEARIPGYRVAGKTGTASKPDDRGGYSSYRYVSSFVGFVPANSPRLVVLVTVDEPHGTIWGGTVAAPAFAQIASFALQYLEIPPELPLDSGA